MNDRTVKAIVLAAGQGKRMKSAVPKQYLLLGGHEVLYYSLKVCIHGKILCEFCFIVDYFVFSIYGN